MSFKLPEAEDLTTRQMMAFLRATRRLKDPMLDAFDESGVPVFEVWTVAAKAAISAKWVEGDVNDIDDMSPKEVMQLGRDVLTTYNKAQGLAIVDPN